ncbi:MAG: hypothetical protein JWR69_3798 [Pedosphaera sp.]|nr:hypothetical protein [Pedosphaera sp.]
MAIGGPILGGRRCPQMEIGQHFSELRDDSATYPTGAEHIVGFYR